MADSRRRCSVHRLPAIDVTRLAADYSAAIRASHTEAELAKIRGIQAIEPDPAIDHAHDFVDANDCMAEAVTKQLGDGWSWCDHVEDIEKAATRSKLAGWHLCRVLVGCEWSGAVREAFKARGHDAMSCDIIDTAIPGKHYAGDVRDVLGDGWHMLIAFPPCTYLCNSGVKHLVRNGQRINPERWDQMHDGAEFFRDLGEAPIERIARENPIMHKYAAEIIGSRADQFIQPYEFGHDVSKRTGLHLKNLSELAPDPADYVPPRADVYRGKPVKRWANQSPCGADRLGPSVDRGHKRGATFAGIANAMADTWGGIKQVAKGARQAMGTITQLELFA
jgi:hypothetical protein